MDSSRVVPSEPAKLHEMKYALVIGSGQRLRNIVLPPRAATVVVTDIRLADDSDLGFTVSGGAGLSGGHGQESGDHELGYCR